MQRPKTGLLAFVLAVLFAGFWAFPAAVVAQEPNDLYVPEPSNGPGAVEQAAPVSMPNITLEPVGPARSSNLWFYLKVGAGIGALLIIISVAKSGRKGLGWLMISYVVVLVSVAFYFVITAIPFRKSSAAAR